LFLYFYLFLHYSLIIKYSNCYSTPPPFPNKPVPLCPSQCCLTTLLCSASNQYQSSTHHPYSLCQPHHIPYCSVFTKVQLSVQMFRATFYNGRSGELILNCLQNKITKQDPDLDKLRTLSQQVLCGGMTLAGKLSGIRPYYLYV